MDGTYDIVILPNRHMYSKFIKTVVMKPYLEHLAPENDDPIDDCVLGIVFR